jgi:arylsulfate sulfotransferase
MNKFLLAAIVACILFSCKKVTTPPATTSPTGDLKTFAIAPDSVTLNPTGNAPLSALVHFTSPISGYTQVVVAGKHGATSNVTQSFTDAGTAHSIPILGLYANYKNTVYVYIIGSNQDTIVSTLSIYTGALPVNVPNYIHTDFSDLTNMESGFNLVSSFSGYPNPPQVPYMVDSFGDIRWYLDFTNNPTLNQLFYDCGIERLQDGNYRFADQHTDQIYEIDVMGKIINTWSLGTYIFHHDIYEKPNGNFLVTVSNPQSVNTQGVQTIEDYIIEIDRSSKAIISTWDLKQSLNEYRTTLDNDPTDWIHCNGVLYDASDNTIIVSGRVQGVVKLDYSNQVKWIMGPHLGWGVNGRGQNLNQYLLTPLDANGNAITDTTVVNGYANATDFEWNWYQHSPRLNPNGDLMVFDNGQTRNYNSNLPNYSRAVEFKINETNMTVQQVWAYGKNNGASTFSPIVSSVQFYADKNHVLFSPGYEVGNATGNGGKIVEVDYATQQVVFQMSISSANGWGFHRVFRMPLYPNGNPYN